MTSDESPESRQRLEMLRAGVQRSVLLGATQATQFVQAAPQLLRELSRISQQFSPQVPSDWLMKRLQFLAYEFSSWLETNGANSGQLSVQQRIDALNEFLFRTKGFVVQPAAEDHKPGDWLLHRILSERKGAAPVVALIYSWLAGRCGVALDWIQLKQDSSRSFVLRFQENGLSHYIDLAQSGRKLAGQELLDICQAAGGAIAGSECEDRRANRADALLRQYIISLKKTLSVDVQPGHLLFLQNLLVSWFPSDFSLLAERAFIHRQLGHLSIALADLKRYFAFLDRRSAPPEARELLVELESALSHPPPAR